MTATRITYYDFSNFLYASYYLSGFAQSARTFAFTFRVSKKAPPVGASGARAFVLLFEAATPDRRFTFCIDTRDQGYRAEHAYDMALLREVDYYFKVNYHREAIEGASELRPFAGKILPAYPFFPVRPPAVWRFAPRLTGGREALRRLKHLRDTRPLERMRALRDVEQDLDLFFVVNVWGKPEHRADDAYRLRLAKTIQSQRDITARVGLVGHGEMPGEFSPLLVDGRHLADYLAQVARARVGIYIRGLHECLSFKLGQLLALGKPVVGQPILNNREHIMSHPRFADQFAFEEPEAIVARARALLANPQEQAALAEANRKTFEVSFSPEAVVADMLGRMGIPKRA